MPRKHRKGAPKYPGSKPGRRPGPRPYAPQKKSAATFHYCIALYREQRGKSEALMMIAEKYRVSIETAERWYKEALDTIRSLDPPTDERIRELREQSREGFEDIHRRAVKTSDLPAANRALSERARLYGLFAPLEVKHGGDVTVSVPLAQDRKSAELRAEIAALSARVNEIEGEQRPSSPATGVDGTAATAPPATTDDGEADE